MFKVRRKNKNQEVKGRSKFGLEGFEWVRQPFNKTIGFFIETCSRWLLTITVGFLLFPFTWESIILDIAVFALAVLFFWRVIKYKRAEGFAWRWWAVASVMFVSTAVCPFIVFPKPLYIAMLESNNPLKSKVSMLEVGGKKVGSLMLVPDYDVVRRQIISFLTSYSPATFRVLERSYYGNSVYYSVPSLKGFVIDIGQLFSLIGFLS